MPRVTYIEPDGTPKAVDAAAGTTLMEAAVDNDVRGIVAECGGACSCATCNSHPAPSARRAGGGEAASSLTRS